MIRYPIQNLHEDSKLTGYNLLDGLLKNSHDQIFFKDRESRFIKVNDKLAYAIGIKNPDDAIGKSDYDFFPDIAERTRADEIRIMETEESQINEKISTVFADGTHHWLSITKAPFYDAEGNVQGIVGISRDITENLEKKETLKQNVSTYQTIFNLSTDTIFIHDFKTGEIIDVNKNVLDTFGYTLDEIKKCTVGDLSLNEPPYTQKEAIEWIQKAACEGPQRFEWIAKTKDGSLLWFDNSLQKITIQGKERILVIGRDITKWKKAENETKSALLFLHDIMDQSIFSMWISDAEGTVIKTNETLCNALHLSSSDIIGKYNVLQDQNLREQGVLSQVEAVFKEKKPARFSIPWKSEKAGSVDFNRGRNVWIDVTIFPIVNADGVLTNAVCQWVDITDSKEAEELLRKKERKYQKEKEKAEMYLDIAGTMLISFNKKGTITMVNKKGCEILGYNNNDELLGKNWFDTCLPSDIVDEVKKVFFKVMKGDLESVAHYENPIVRRDGESRLISWYNTIIKDDYGNNIGILSSGEDITEKHEMQEKLQRIFDLSSDFICEADIHKTLFTKINPAFIKTLGYSEEELLSHSFLDFIHPDDQKNTKK